MSLLQQIYFRQTYPAAGGAPPPPPNVAPVVNDQAFAIMENSPNGTVVGTVAASDPNFDVITFAITGTAFAINANTGVITVLDSAQLDFETTPVFTPTVTVDDGMLQDTAVITINLTDVFEPVSSLVTNTGDFLVTNTGDFLVTNT